MHPVAFTFQGYEIRWYGLMIAIGFVVCTVVGARLAKRAGVRPEHSIDLAFWGLIAGLVGARLMFYVVNWQKYYQACFHHETLGLSQSHCWDVLYVWRGGHVWYGGLLGALLIAIWFLRRRKIPYFVMADAVMPGVALGHFFGRLGCFCAGCCWGTTTTSAAGIHFPEGSIPFRHHAEQLSLLMNGRTESLAVHPTQLYEASGELLIFFILLGLYHYKRFHGQVFLGYLFLYPILRIVTETFRGDSERGFLITWDHVIPFGHLEFVLKQGISTSQLISFGVALAAVLLAFHMWRRKKIRDVEEAEARAVELQLLNRRTFILICALTLSIVLIAFWLSSPLAAGLAWYWIVLEAAGILFAGQLLGAGVFRWVFLRKKRS